MPVGVFVPLIAVSLIIFMIPGAAAIADKNKGAGVTSFIGFCLLCAAITWLSMAAYQPLEYLPAVNGRVATSVNPDKQILSTAAYEVDGVIYLEKLEGFLPAGIPVRILRPKVCYYGVDFTPMKIKVELVEEPDKETL